MARIGPSDANQHLVFAGDVSNDVTLAFAAILSADENIDEPIEIARKQNETREGESQKRGLADVLILHNAISDTTEFPNSALCAVCADLFVRRRVAT